MVNLPGELHKRPDPPSDRDPKAVGAGTTPGAPAAAGSSGGWKVRARSWPTG